MEGLIMDHSSLARKGFLLACGAGALAACSSTPSPNPTLSQAQETYSAASNDPAVHNTAPERLADAQDALQTAQHAWKNGDEAETNHNAYLAQRYAQTAIEAAKFRSSGEQAANAARIVTLPGVLFETNKANLKPNGLKAVKDLADFVSVRPNRTLMIAGYTDATGSAKLNSMLSAHRAAAVKTALVAQGVDGSRIETKGMGPSNPVRSNATAAGRQMNRRVEVLISQAADTAATTSPGA
jgi:outer membrane protein OmpA-like peptidoglycan-associated protein